MVTDSGTSNLTIVSAEPETGTELNVLCAQLTPTGTEEAVLLALEVECGTLWIWSANVLNKPNGTELPVLGLALTAKSFKTVFAFAHLANSSKKENVSTIQNAKMAPLGTVKNVSVFHATQELPSTTSADVVKPQCLLALQAPIGMATDVST